MSANQRNISRTELMLVGRRFIVKQHHRMMKIKNFVQKVWEILIVEWWSGFFIHRCRFEFDDKTIFILFEQDWPSWFKLLPWLQVGSIRGPLFISWLKTERASAALVAPPLHYARIFHILSKKYWVFLGQKSCSNTWNANQKYGILLPKLFWPTVRKNCSSDREKCLKFES